MPPHTSMGTVVIHSPKIQLTVISRGNQICRQTRYANFVGISQASGSTCLSRRLGQQGSLDNVLMIAHRGRYAVKFTHDSNCATERHLTSRTRRLLDVHTALLSSPCAFVCNRSVNLIGERRLPVRHKSLTWRLHSSVPWARNRSPGRNGSPHRHLDRIPQAQFRYNHVSTTSARASTSTSGSTVGHGRVRERHVIGHEVD